MPRDGMVNVRHMVDDVQASGRGRPLPRCRARAPERHRQGSGGSQILLVDPSGNVIELFQPAGT